MNKADKHALLRPLFIGGQFIHLIRGIRAHHADVSEAGRRLDSCAVEVYRARRDLQQVRSDLAAVAVKGGAMERMLTDSRG